MINPNTDASLVRHHPQPPFDLLIMTTNQATGTRNIGPGNISSTHDNDMHQDIDGENISQTQILNMTQHCDDLEESPFSPLKSKNKLFNAGVNVTQSYNNKDQKADDMIQEQNNEDSLSNANDKRMNNTLPRAKTQVYDKNNQDEVESSNKTNHKVVYSKSKTGVEYTDNSAGKDEINTQIQKQYHATQFNNNFGMTA